MARGNNTLLALVILGGGVYLGLTGVLGKQIQMSLGQTLSSLFPKPEGCKNPLRQGLLNYCRATCVSIPHR